MLLFLKLLFFFLLFDPLGTLGGPPRPYGISGNSRERCFGHNCPMRKNVFSIFPPQPEGKFGMSNMAELVDKTR